MIETDYINQSTAVITCSEEELSAVRCSIALYESKGWKMTSEEIVNTPIKKNSDGTLSVFPRKYKYTFKKWNH